MPSNTSTSNQPAPAQDVINEAFFAALHRIEQRLDAVTTSQQPQQPQAVVGPMGVLAATLGKNGKPLRAKREDVLFGAHPHADDILAAARRAAEVDLAYDLGIAQEPDREGLSPWAIAGIAVGAAALGAGVAVGVSAYMNSNDDK